LGSANFLNLIKKEQERKAFDSLVNLLKHNQGETSWDENKVIHPPYTTGESIVYYCHKLDLNMVVEDRDKIFEIKRNQLICLFGE
jgi:hypothetical protein